MGIVGQNLGGLICTPLKISQGWHHCVSQTRHLSWKLWRSICFQVHSGCWQIPVSCRHRIGDTIFLLNNSQGLFSSSRGHLHSSSHGTSIFKPAMAQRILFMIRFSLTSPFAISQWKFSPFKGLMELYKAYPDNCPLHTNSKLID